MTDKAEVSPIITLPANQELQAQLQAKLTEYKQRLERQGINSFTPPEIRATSKTWYAVRILETVLNEGAVGTFDLSREIAAELGEYFDVHHFEQYAAVIDDYCKTGGVNANGGTGLISNDQS